MNIVKIKISGENLNLTLANDKRTHFTLLRVYDYEKQVLVTRDVIGIENDVAKIPISLFMRNFHDRVKYVIDLKESNTYPDGKENVILKFNNLYNLHIYTDHNSKVTFEFRAIKKLATLKEIVNSQKSIQICLKDEFPNVTKSLLAIKRRVATNLWNFHDKEIEFSIDCNRTSIQLEEIIDKLNYRGEKEVWDFIYKCLLSDGTEYETFIYSGSFGQEIFCCEGYCLNLYSGKGQTLALESRKNTSLSTAKLLSYEEVNEKIILKCQLEKVKTSKNSKLVIALVNRPDDQWKIEDLNYVAFSPREILDDKVMVFELPVGRYLTGNLQKIKRFESANESWNAYISIDGQLNDILCLQNFNSSYLPASDRLDAKFYAKNKKLRLYTHNGLYKQNKKIDIAVFGTCLSRNIFRSVPFFNDDYKIWYNCKFTQFHSTMISMASKPYHGLDDKLSTLDKVAKRYIELDFHKQYELILKKNKPDYILIDLYADALLPTIETTNRERFTLNLYTRYSSIINGVKNLTVISQQNWDSYFSLFKESADNVINRLLQIVDERKIILISSRLATEFKDNAGLRKSFGNLEKIQKDNIIWDRLESYILTKYRGIRIIDMKRKKWIAQKENPLGFSSSHYESGYYNDCLNELNKIVLEDIINLD